MSKPCPSKPKGLDRIQSFFVFSHKKLVPAVSDYRHVSSYRYCCTGIGKRTIVSENKIKRFNQRKLFIWVLIMLLAYLATVFFSQYNAYLKVRPQLDSAYASGQDQSTTLYRLFSDFGEAENLFRLYTVGFDRQVFMAYRKKLEEINIRADSLSEATTGSSSLKLGSKAVGEKDRVAQEYAALKMALEDLIYMAEDSLISLNPNSRLRAAPIAPKGISERSKEQKETLKLKLDTLVIKKKGLFDRIFRSKDDTVITSSWTVGGSGSLADSLRSRIADSGSHLERAKGSEIGNIQKEYTSLRLKETELINANYRLLVLLERGIENIKEHERQKLRAAERKNLELYKDNSQKFGTQMFGALFLMSLMLVFIISYQYNAERYERKLRQEKDYAARVAQERTAALASVSHEVRAPIDALSEIVGYLRSRSGLGGPDRALLDSVSYDIGAIHRNITDILSLIKMEGGENSVTKEFFHPARLIGQLIQVQKYAADKKGLDIATDIAIAEQIQICSCEFRIKQIVSNLLSNAIKYTSRGTVSISVRISDSNGHPALQVRVEDTGTGISKDQQKYIFRQYYRIRENSRATGFGLGLYISKLLAEQIDGKITLRSTPGRGSTFSLQVRLAKDGIKIDHSGPKSISDIPKDIRMVIIEDNKINSFYMSQLFEGFANVRVFLNSSDALDYILANPVDLILTDLHMPGPDGWDVLSMVRNEREFLPVLALTSENRDNVYTGREDTGNRFDRVLSKPLVSSELAEAVLSCLSIKGSGPHQGLEKGQTS